MGNFFEELIEDIQFYPEDLTLLLIRSLDEEKNRSDIKYIKSRMSTQGWRYQLGFVWYESGKLKISQHDPFRKSKNSGRGADSTWILHLKPGTKLKKLRQNIKGKKNRKFIPLIFKENRDDTYSIASYKELCSTNNSRYGVEKYFYLYSIGNINARIEHILSTDPVSLNKNLEKYFNEILNEKNRLKSRIYFSDLHTLNIVCKILSISSDNRVNNYIYRKLNRYLDNDIKVYMETLGAPPPKGNREKIEILTPTPSLLPIFIESHKFDKGILGKVSDKLSDIEIEIQNGYNIILKERSNRLLFDSNFSNLKKYTILAPLISTSIILILTIIDFEWNINFLALTLTSINTTSLSLLAIIILASGAIYTIIAAVSLILPEYLFDIIEKCLGEKGIPKSVKARKIIAYSASFIPMFLLILGVAFYAARENFLLTFIILLIMFLFMHIYAIRQRTLAAFRQEKLVRNNINFIFVIVVTIASIIFSLSLQIHPLKSCSFIVSGNHLYYYEYVTTNSWADKSNIAFLKNSQYLITSEDVGGSSDIEGPLINQNQISTPSIVNIENKYMPPQTTCPANTPSASTENDIIESSYLDYLSDRGILYYFTNANGNPKFELHQ